MSDRTPRDAAPASPAAAHSAEHAIVEARKAKAARVRDRGENPFANDVVPRAGGETLDISAARALAGAP